VNVKAGEGVRKVVRVNMAMGVSVAVGTGVDMGVCRGTDLNTSVSVGNSVSISLDVDVHANVGVVADMDVGVKRGCKRGKDYTQAVGADVRMSERAVGKDTQRECRRGRRLASEETVKGWMPRAQCTCTDTREEFCHNSIQELVLLYHP
jgi:hypothetical protein